MKKTSPLTRAIVRHHVAAFLWDVRRMEMLAGDWTRREWYDKCRNTAHQLQNRMESGSVHTN